MAYWITVYCRKKLEVDPSMLTAGINGMDPDAFAGVDYSTLAEDYDIDDSLVDGALEHLRITSGGEVYFREDPAQRPIAIHEWREPSRVAEEISEARETREAPPSAEPYLTSCVTIIALELGFPMLENMGIVIAYEIARYLAQKGDGIIVDDDDRWQRVEHGAFVLLPE